MESRTVGTFYLGLIGVLFIYYTAWVIGLPFVDESYQHLVKRIFPLPVEYALGIPCALAATLLSALWLRAYQLVRQDRRESNKAKQA